MNRFARTFEHGGGPSSQRGAVLVVAMVLLLVLTMLGVTALNTTSVEERMAANSQEQARAFQAAEAGVSAFFASPVETLENRSLPLEMGPAAQAGANYTRTSAADLACRKVMPGEGLFDLAQDHYFYFGEVRSEGFSQVTDGGAAWTPEPSAATATVTRGFRIFTVTPCPEGAPSPGAGVGSGTDGSGQGSDTGAGQQPPAGT